MSRRGAPFMVYLPAMTNYHRDGFICPSRSLKWNNPLEIKWQFNAITAGLQNREESIDTFLSKTLAVCDCLSSPLVIKRSPREAAAAAAITTLGQSR